MTERLLLQQSEADVEFTPLEIRSELPNDAVETGSEEDLEFTKLESKLLFGIRFNWRLIPTEGSYRLIEKKYASVYFFAALVFTSSVLLFGLTIVELLSGIFVLLNFGVVILSASILYSLSGYGADQSPVRDIFDKGDNRFYANQLITLLIGVVLLAPLSVIDSFYKIFCPFIFLFLSRFYWEYQDIVVERTTRWQRKIRDLIKAIPKIVLAYCISIFAFLLIETLCLVVVSGDFSSVFNSSPILFSSLLIGLFLFLIYATYNGVQLTHRIVSTHLDLGKQIEIPLSKLVVTTFLVVSWSIIFALYSGYLMVSGLNFAAETGQFAVYLVVLTAVAPIFYYMGGVVYQFSSFLYDNAVLAVKSEPVDLGLDRSVPLRIVDSEVCTAGAVHLGFTRFVVVSQGLVDELSQSELEAVVVHEEGHFHYSDAWLALLAGLLASFIFTGRNVLFGVLEFRSREFRADRYAVDEVGEDAVVAALNRLQEVEYRENPGSAAGLSPTVTNFSVNTPRGLLESIFGFYYGSFALSGVHPSLSSRKSAIRRSSN
ncbi:M48 family metalloprotease [Halobaculum sp. WSA2]|uniref:M48 family metalloprotease n=1 Tax=Halobaculum saliterrae TaxID=2073113 RepID=A0A6B0SMW7_9EURY|nr:M48 family metalloprotease [Halobaculum saliterrae]MXR40075.1 M48 family metalloprotease [Halobaculum saliterrae]